VWSGRPLAENVNSRLGRYSKNGRQISPRIVYPILLFSFVVSACTEPSGIETGQPTEVRVNDMASDAIEVTIDSEQKIWIDGEIVDQQTLRRTLERLCTPQTRNGRS
jgi:biopolymer transport protein ExbD